MIKHEILNAIDNIDITRAESEMYVIESMVLEFDKSFMILDNCDNKNDFFQEGVLDDVKKESKKDSNKLVSVLKFIPRLIKALIDILKRKIKDANIGDRFKEYGEKLDSIKDMKEKEARVKELNEKFDGRCECYIDEKTGKIKFKKNGKSIIETLGWIGGFAYTAAKLYEKIAENFDYTNPSKIRSFVDDMDALIHGNTDVKPIDVFSGGIAAIGDALKLLTASMATLTTASGMIENVTQHMEDKEMIKDVPNEKKQEVLKNINELSGKMTKVNAIITGTVGSVMGVLDKIDVFTDFSKKVNEKITAIEKKITEKRYKYIQEYKKKYPRYENESPEDYNTRITLMVNKDHDSEMYKEAKAEYKQEQKNAKQQSKAEYLAEKEKRRNNNNESSDNDDKEQSEDKKEDEVKDNG